MTHPRVILVTGASSGFGAAMITALAGAGHRVYGTSRRAAEPEANAVPPVMLPLDVGDDESVRAAVALVLAREGGLDVVVNNAGVGLAGALEDTSDAEAAALLDTNLLGVHRVCRAVLPAMRARGRGLVVNVGSIGGEVALPFQGFYSASKAALAAYSAALRMEAAPFGVDVTLLAPGDFRTGFTTARVVAAAATATDSPYGPRAMRAIAAMGRDEQDGADPRAVGDLVVRIVAANRPRATYTVGAAVQRAAPLLRRLVPTRAWERIIRSHYGA